MKYGNCLALVALTVIAATPALAQFRSGGLTGSAQMMGRKDIQNELKLTPDQSRKVADLQLGIKADLQKMIRGLQQVPPDQRRGKFDSFRDSVDRKLVEILDAKQRKRLNELQLQKDGTRSLMKSDVIAELRLTDEQRKKTGEALRAENQEIRNLYKEVSAGKKELTAADQGKANQGLIEIRKKTDETLVGLLTDQQRSQWTKMQGQPFQFLPGRALAKPQVAPAAVKPGTRKPAVVKPAAGKPGQN
jgi:hypothetical protein